MWEISYANLMMLLASIPKYDKEESGEKEGKEEIISDDLGELFKPRKKSK